MKKCLAILLFFLVLVSVSACGTQEKEVQQDQPTGSTQIKISPDKYTWYIKDYVGRNCASVGYTSWGGERIDASYGAAYVKLIFMTADGAYVDIEDEDILKKYSITAQNIEPNTEMKLTFQKDSDGEEYDSLTEWQSIEEIVLSVEKIGSLTGETNDLTAITPSADKYTHYVRDYVGRNLANCGYTSLGGNRVDAYGGGYIQLNLITSDGAYIDIEDEETLQNYRVTAQGVAPNEEIKLDFLKNSDGQEYSNLVDSQNLNEIDLFVEQIR